MNKLFKFIGRVVLYGAIGALFAAPIAYNIGYKRGALDNTIQTMDSSRLERIADDQYKVMHPEEHKEYMLDFNERIIVPYKEKSLDKEKQLDDIFSN